MNCNKLLVFALLLNMNISVFSMDTLGDNSGHKYRHKPKIEEVKDVTNCFSLTCASCFCCCLVIMIAADAKPDVPRELHATPQPQYSLEGAFSRALTKQQRRHQHME